MRDTCIILRRASRVRSIRERHDSSQGVPIQSQLRPADDISVAPTYWRESLCMRSPGQSIVVLTGSAKSIEFLCFLAYR